MDIKFIEFDKKSIEYNKLKKLYFNTFPIHERYPLSFLIKKSKSENVKFYNVFDDEIWIGFIYLICNDCMVMLQYLAVEANIRSKGYGGKILEKIKNIYAGKTIVLGIEKPDDKCRNNENRMKRKKFYLNNGFIESGYYIKQKPIPFEMFISGNDFSMERLFELYSCFFKLNKSIAGKILWKILYKLVKNRIVKYI